jgi:hypothetical protein
MVVVDTSRQEGIPEDRFEEKVFGTRLGRFGETIRSSLFLFLLLMFLFAVNATTTAITTRGPIA